MLGILGGSGSCSTTLGTLTFGSGVVFLAAATLVSATRFSYVVRWVPQVPCGKRQISILSFSHTYLKWSRKVPPGLDFSKLVQGRVPIASHNQQMKGVALFDFEGINLMVSVFVDMTQ